METEYPPYTHWFCSVCRTCSDEMFMLGETCPECGEGLCDGGWKLAGPEANGKPDDAPEALAVAVEAEGGWADFYYPGHRAYVVIAQDLGIEDYEVEGQCDE